MEPDQINNFFNEEALTSSDQISLYKELLRVLEKDIDEIQSQNSREGWSVWGILGAIATAAGVFFSQTKDLNIIPQSTPMIACSFAILFFSLSGVFTVISSPSVLVKPGRLINARDAYKGRRFLFVLRLFFLLVADFVILSSDLAAWVKIVTILLPLLPSTFFLGVVFWFQRSDRSLGNTPVSSKYQGIWGLFFLFCYWIPVVFLFSYLPPPVGAQLTAGYVMGIMIAVIVFLLEVLFSVVAPPMSLAELQTLRDDIVFRRLNLNDALGRYKVLREGKSLFEEVKVEYDQIISQLTYQDQLYSVQSNLLSEIGKLEVPVGGTTEGTASRKAQIETLDKSLEIHQHELENSHSLVKEILPKFYDRLKKAAEATGDYDNQLMIGQLLQHRFDSLVGRESQVNALRNKLSDRK